ncbi:MAG: tRNA (adenosine(37)-N6)-threonylcarbamoyltransferase complex transferase subunit TsaD [Planctomycetes bacterium]|nr:tRNA (adenosine(37)-N6)-threonylcarbamoyltransferase complex transferase subunit TsaD [Planctomycetota bacterium]
MLLAIESSCDEAAVAIVAEGWRVLAEVHASFADDLAAWGGVVPEIAARGHIACFPGLVDRALQAARVELPAIRAVAVTAWPGLIGSLLAGVTVAKAIALRRDLPLIAVDHIAAHLAAVHLGQPQVPYPFVGLVASGGHSHYYLARAPGELELLGGTIDDAAGEAFDKAAQILGLPYPGGPRIDQLAEQGDPRALSLPRPLIDSGDYRLSFAGLKTALLYQARGPLGQGPLRWDAQGIADACASFRAAVVEVLVRKLALAAERHRVRTIAVGGGVACNRALRSALQQLAAERHWRLLLPEPQHCSDNAAMVGALGWFLWQRGCWAAADLAPLPTGAAGPRRAGSGRSGTHDAGCGTAAR